MNKVRVLVVGPPNTGKTTIAHIIQNALKEAGWQNIKLIDTPDTENKEPIVKRVQAARERLVSIEVVATNRIALGDAALISSWQGK